VARALLESGADPTIFDYGDYMCTPMEIARDYEPPRGVTDEGREECVAALEVRLVLLFLALPSAPVFSKAAG
jgi:hypothetical protein